VVFVVVFVQFLDLKKIGALDVNGWVGNLKRDKKAVVSGNALKRETLNVVSNAKSFHAKYTTTRKEQSTPGEP